MNRETRRNVCKNKLISKSDLPTTPSEFPRSPELCPLPQGATPQPAVSRKCYGVSAEAPSPEFSSHSGPSRSKAVGPFSLQSCVCEGLLRFGEAKSEWRDTRCGYGGKVRCEKPFAPKPPGRRRRSRVSPPGTPKGCVGRSSPRARAGVVVRWQGGQGLQFFMEEASGGLVSGREPRGQPLPSGVELLLFGRLLVGTTVGLFRLLQRVAALILLLHPVQHETDQAHSQDEPHEASANDPS